MYSSKNKLAISSTVAPMGLRPRTGRNPHAHGLVVGAVLAVGLAVGGGPAVAVVGDRGEPGKLPGSVGHLRQGAQGRFG